MRWVARSKGTPEGRARSCKGIFHLQISRMDEDSARDCTPFGSTLRACHPELPPRFHHRWAPCPPHLGRHGQRANVSTTDHRWHRSARHARPNAAGMAPSGRARFNKEVLKLNFPFHWKTCWSTMTHGNGTAPPYRKSTISRTAANAGWKMCWRAPQRRPASLRYGFYAGVEPDEADAPASPCNHKANNDQGRKNPSEQGITEEEFDAASRRGYGRRSPAYCLNKGIQILTDIELSQLLRTRAGSANSPDRE